MRVALTSSPQRSEAITFLLEDEGAQVLHLPLLERDPPDDPRPFRATVEHLHRYPRILLSSLEAVTALWDGARVAGTTAALKTAGLIACTADVSRVLTAVGHAPAIDLAAGHALAIDADTEVLVPLGAFDPTWPHALADAGAVAIAVLAWTPAEPALPDERPDVIVFDAPGAASALRQARPAWVADAGRVAASSAIAAELKALGLPAHTTAQGGADALLDAAQRAFAR